MDVWTFLLRARYLKMGQGNRDADPHESHLGKIGTVIPRTAGLFGNHDARALRRRVSKLTNYSKKRYHDPRAGHLSLNEL